jgi:hypothetical protein
MAGESTKPLDIINLMSPPNAVYDNFHTMSTSRTMAPPVNQKPISRPPNAPLSPPISPFAKINPTINASPPQIRSVPVKDPILYPQPAAPSVSARQPPLFLTDENRTGGRAVHHDVDGDAERIIDEYLLRRSPLSEYAQPTREDYNLVLSFRSDVMRRYQADPRGWLNQERALLAVDRVALRQRQRALPSILPARSAAKAHPTSIRVNTSRIQKPVRPREPKLPKQKQSNPRPIRTNGGPGRSTIRISATPEPRARTVAANREDKDFAALPDYCPPLNTLPNKPNSLKVDWKAANPLDLSNDPLKHLLHPDELSLAANLRLDCATYLTSKRRIFQSRLQCARRGKEFRKTDAQQACKIDVNKASKLWMAYDNVGWLDIRWMANFPN